METSPEQYISGLEEPRKSQIQALFDMVRQTEPGLEPFVIAGKIGFGKFHYKSKSGCEGDWFKIGLSSNKNTIMFATCAMDPDRKSLAEAHAEKLPKAKIGKSCINFRKFEDIDFEVLKEIVKKTAKADFSQWEV